MALFKTTITATAEIDLWLEADSLQHAESLVKANDEDTYNRVRSSVDFPTGSIRVKTDSIEINSIELEE